MRDDAHQPKAGRWILLGNFLLFAGLFYAQLRVAGWRYELHDIQYARKQNVVSVITYDRDGDWLHYHIQLLALSSERTRHLQLSVPNWPPAEMVLSDDGSRFAYSDSDQIHVVAIDSDKSWSTPLPPRFAGRLSFVDASSTLSFLCESNAQPPQPQVGMLWYESGRVTRQLIDQSTPQRWPESNAESNNEPQASIQLEDYECRLLSDYRLRTNTKRVIGSSPERLTPWLTAGLSLSLILCWLNWIRLQRSAPRSPLPWLQIIALHGIVMAPSATWLFASQQLLVTRNAFPVQAFVGSSASLIVACLFWIVNSNRWPSQLSCLLLIFCVLGSNHVLLGPWQSTDAFAIRVLAMTMFVAGLLFGMASYRFLKLDRGQHSFPANNRRGSHANRVYIQDIIGWTMLSALIFVLLRQSRFQPPRFFDDKNGDALALAVSASVVLIRWLWHTRSTWDWALLTFPLALAVVALVPSTTFALGMLGSGVLLAALTGLAFRRCGYSLSRQASDEFEPSET